MPVLRRCANCLGYGVESDHTFAKEYSVLGMDSKEVLVDRAGSCRRLKETMNGSHVFHYE